MRISLCFDMRNPPRWRRSWASFYAWNLDLAVRAEQLGLDAVWTTEHHFFEDGYLSQPLTFIAAVAARTTTIRVGTAIMLAPLRPAIQIAEEAAVVDLISGGRVDLGLGAGYRLAEFAAYGADVTTRYRVLDERAKEVRALFDGGNVMPPPVQERLPIWMGYLGAKGARRAGVLGENLLTLVPGTFDAYRAGLIEGGHDPTAARVAGLVHAVVADDPEATWAEIGPYVEYQLYTYIKYATDDDNVVPPHVDAASIRAAGQASAAPGIFPNFVIVTPTEAIDMLRRIAPSGAASTEAFFWASVAGMPEAVCERHIELLATEVRPHVADL